MVDTPQERVNARMAQLRAGGFPAAPAAAAKIKETVEVKTVIATAPVVVEQKAYDVTANPVFKLMNDSTKSNKQKIDSVSKYLTAEGEDYDTARTHMLDFEMYFAHDQAERTKLDEESIQKLIDELESATKAEVQIIVKNITDVQEGSKRISQLLDVLHTARLDKKSIEQISEALKYNDRLIREIADLERSLKDLREREIQADAQVTRQLARKTDSHSGIGNKFLRLIGEDKSILAAIDMAQSDLVRAQEAVANSGKLLTEKASQRDTNLENGSLTILRSIDATEKGFSDEIVKTAKQALALIGSIRTSTERLLERNKHSREAAVETTKRIDASKVRETILGSAVQQALTATQAQGTAIRAELGALDAQLETLGDGSSDSALIKVARIEKAQKSTGADSHVETLGKAVSDFRMLEADNTTAEAKAKQFASLVTAHFDLFSNIQKRVLPTTARALKMGLEQDYAMGVGELGQIINAAAESAREISANNLQGLTTAQDEMRQAELTRIDAMYAEVMEAQSVVADTIDKIVSFGAESAERQGRLIVATDALSKLGESFSEVGALVSDRTGNSLKAGSAETPVHPGGTTAGPRGAALRPMVA